MCETYCRQSEGSEDADQSKLRRATEELPPDVELNVAGSTLGLVYMGHREVPYRGGARPRIQQNPERQRPADHCRPQIVALDVGDQDAGQEEEFVGQRGNDKQ